MFSGPLASPVTTPKDEVSTPLGRRLIIPLQVCVSQGLRFVKARLLSMEIPAHIGEKLPKAVNLENSSDASYENQSDSLVRMDPYRGSWDLRLLELELSNPTDVSFEVNVSVQMEKPECNIGDSSDFCCPKTRIDRDYSARVLIPLEHFKLAVLDSSFFAKEGRNDDSHGSRALNTAERSSKAELNASINNLISRIKVKWQSGRNSSGELNIKDAIQTALQTSVMDVLLPDPLTFGFRLSKNCTTVDNADSLPGTSILHSRSNGSSLNDMKKSSICSKGSILAHEMTPMEVLIRNNTKETIRIGLTISCRDIAGDNCIEGRKATVLWEGNFLEAF